MEGRGEKKVEREILKIATQGKIFFCVRDENKPQELHQSEPKVNVFSSLLSDKKRI